MRSYQKHGSIGGFQMRGVFCGQLALFLLLLIVAVPSRAGVDIAGPVQRVHVAADGALWFSMDTTVASTYCQPGWYGLTMYVPANHPQYAYYFAMLMSSASKGNSVVVANISVFNGSTACDITKTGYGLVFLK